MSKTSSPLRTPLLRALSSRGLSSWRGFSLRPASKRLILQFIKEGSWDDEHRDSAWLPFLSRLASSPPRKPPGASPAPSHLYASLHNALIALILFLALLLVFQSSRPRPSASDALPGLPPELPMTATPIPGSRLQTPQQVAQFQQRLRCSTGHGRWEVDPTPRLLPWPYDEGNYGHCDGRWTWRSGRLSHQAADDVVLRSAPASEWAVRPTLKFAWRADPAKCGPHAQLRPWSSRGLSRVLLQENAQGQGVGGAGRPQNERIVVFVGDSMQHSLAVSLYDNMRMGLRNATEEAVPLVPSSLPCFTRALAHRRMCWGAHFFAKSQPGMKMLFVRNDFLSLVAQPTWERSGKHFQLPWIETVRALLQGQLNWQEGGTMRQPGRRRTKEQEQEEENIRVSARGSKVLPPVLVLNRGVHYVEDSRFYQELNASMRATRELCAHCLIIFRNTPGGHKGCNKIELPLVEPPRDTSLPFNWTEVALQSRDFRTREIVESVGGVFLDVETMTLLRADGHTGKNRQGTEDCTHYCAPGPVDTWTQLLYDTLHELLP